MSSVGGLKPISTAASSASMTPAEKNKQWQRELLMERIRSHSSQHRSFPELSKSMRMSMLEKRYALDAVEKSNLQKCLDSMQHCIKVTSRQGLVERLESLSRQLGLKFMEDTSGLFISTDMFYLEIMLDANGSLTDVKVHHECKIEQQSCSELVNCLNRGDFADFTIQLEGLSSIYQLNAEPKIKTKAFVALQAMETDLYNLFQIQNFSKDTQSVVADSIVGIVLKRRGGHPMKLTYFISPYDLINIESKSIQPLTIDLITSSNIGMSVTVNLEASSTNKLQILPTVSFVKDQQGQTEIDVPIYSPLTQLNSALLPATFVLRLNKPLPVCYNTLRMLLPVAVADNIGIDKKSASSLSTPLSPPAPIMNVLVQTASDNQIQNAAKGLFVCLPDQTHCYFFTENKHMQASLLSSVPFTEPSEVPKILKFLKRQALFYTLLASCIRPQAKMGDMDSTTILEVNATSFQQISVALEHPYEESMATVDFILSDKTVVCSIYSMNSTEYDVLSAKLTKIVQKSLSIPVTIRSLLKQWDEDRMKIFQRVTPAVSDYGNFSLVMGPNDSGGGRSGGGGGNSSSANVGGAMIGPNGNAVIKTENLALVDRSGSGTGNNSATASNNFPSMNRQFFHPVPPEGFPELVATSSSGGGGGGGGVSGTVAVTGGNSSGNNIGPLGASGAIASSIGSNSSAVAASGILKQFKNEIKQEDFCKSPKSNQPTMQIELADSSSLGKCTMQPVANTVADNTQTYGVASSSTSSQSSAASLSLPVAGSTQPANKQQTSVEPPPSSSINQSISLNTTEESVKFSERSTDIAEKYQKIWKDKTAMKNTVSITPILSSDLSSNVRSQTSLGGGSAGPSGLDTKRPGIEIIPLSTSSNPAQNTNTTAAAAAAAAATASASASSITITPINSTGLLTVFPSSKTEKKSYSPSPLTSSSSSSSSSSSKRNITDSNELSSSGKSSEKKRKRKRDDSPMRPPEKIFSRQNSPATDALTLARKFSSPQTSPKSVFLASNNSGTNSGGNTIASPSISPGGGYVSPSPKPSPKHSPVNSSPKHMIAVPSGSPKSPFGTLSPKHGSSGKPSMSTLKNATANSNPKNEKSSTSNTAVGSSSSSRSSLSSSSSVSSSSTKNRDKDSSNKDRSSSLSPQLKSQQSMNKSMATKYLSSALPLSSISQQAIATGTAAVGFPAIPEYTNANAGQISRKTGGSLSAVIDKLKLAHNPSDDDEVFSSSSTHGFSNCQVNLTKQPATAAAATDGVSSTGAANAGSSEYMVKPSHDGIKITINKTKSQTASASCGAVASSSSSSLIKTKSFGGSSSKSASSYSGGTITSPVKKPHTGLKPGVNSGPASKKSSSPSLSPSNLSFATGGGGSSKSMTSNLGGKCGFQKSNSSGCLSSKTAFNMGSSNTLTKSQSTSSFTSESCRPSKIGNISSTASLYTASGMKKSSASSGAASSLAQHSSSSSSSSSSLPSTSSHFPVRSDPHADMMKILQFASPNMALDGFMKTFNTKFQIPKLSARLNSTTTTTTATTATATTTATTAAATTTSSSSVASESSNATMTTAIATEKQRSSATMPTVGGSSSSTSSNYFTSQQQQQQQQNYHHLQSGSCNEMQHQLPSKKYPLAKSSTSDYHHGLNLNSLTPSSAQSFSTISKSNSNNLAKDSSMLHVVNSKHSTSAIGDPTKLSQLTSSSSASASASAQSSSSSTTIQQQQQLIDDQLVGVGGNK